MHVRVRERERATYCVCAFIYVYTYIYIYISIFLLCRYFLVTCYNNPIRSVKRIHIIYIYTYIYIYVVNIKKIIVEKKASAHESRSEYFDRD